MDETLIIDNPNELWTPKSGSETSRLRNRVELSQQDWMSLQNSSIGILQRCIPPNPVSQIQSAGLVLGYVQSGKTLSYTTLITLAKDNKYRLIIVIAGTKTNLFNQTLKRLRLDLELDEAQTEDLARRRSWKLFSNPKKGNIHEINDALLQSADNTVLIAVMKNAPRLNALQQALKGINLQSIPCLIIDDEADQASLNTKVQVGGESATYRSITLLRETISCHTFIQYTATPQALLLISLIDLLSPSFAVVIQPGTDYTGGKFFFRERVDLIRQIPDDEIPSKRKTIEGMPASLRTALCVFFIGVAVGQQNHIGRNRSMMIHPSKEVERHANYFEIVSHAKRVWLEMLEKPNGHPDREDLLLWFRHAYDDLCNTTKNLPAFDEIVQKLPDAIRRTALKELNTRKAATSSDIDWYQEYSHILVGGEVLSRGFTIEGLTVTYMPRSIGTGIADTVQQRARWFGYKKKYSDLCRIYISQEARLAYSDYVDHEEELRQQLQEYGKTKQSLKQWRRAFLLSDDLTPTRSNVIGMPTVKIKAVDGWLHPDSPHTPIDYSSANSKLIDDFINRHEFRPYQDFGSDSEMQKHSIARNVLISDTLELLAGLQYQELGDAQKIIAVMFQLKHMENTIPKVQCDVIQMSSGKVRKRNMSTGAINELFQGPQRNIKSGGEYYYPGDREIRGDNHVTIQFHRITDTNQEITPLWVPAIHLSQNNNQSWILGELTNG